MRHLRLRRLEEYLPPWVLALAPRLGTAAIAPGTLAQGVWALPPSITESLLLSFISLKT